MEDFFVLCSRPKEGGNLALGRTARLSARRARAADSLSLSACFGWDEEQNR